jgi:hypothetical protein
VLDTIHEAYKNKTVKSNDWKNVVYFLSEDNGGANNKTCLVFRASYNSCASKDRRRNAEAIILRQEGDSTNANVRSNTERESIGKKIN